MKYTDLSEAEYRSQTTMESMGPVRPNLITRWTKFQAQENPQQYDLDDGIVIAQEKAQPNKAKKNLRSRNKDILYQDSIIVQMGPAADLSAGMQQRHGRE